ncbi:MAG: asparaginase, partial [Candidatus Heimdallarchaeota archaeon]|nr:asparaginase [Candidatus Heimdallarchaeota archaeon]
MKKRIVVLGMGGTISSVLNESGLSPGKSSLEILSMMPELDDYYDLETRELMGIDSSNLQPRDWCVIAEEVYSDISRKDVDGVVIVHGTDTMTYTASALALMIRN